MWPLFKLLSKLFPCWVQTGTIVVRSSGEFTVDLPFTPSDVVLEPDNVCGMGVCLGEMDGFDRVIIPEGFIIEATLKSEKRTIKWLATK